jgi:hypothetical protein
MLSPHVAQRQARFLVVSYARLEALLAALNLVMKIF